MGCWLWVVGRIVYLTVKPKPTTDNLQPATTKQKVKDGNRHIPPFTFLYYLELLEEIIALVIHEDKGREILYANLPYSLHTELRILHALDALDIAG